MNLPDSRSITCIAATSAACLDSAFSRYEPASAELDQLPVTVLPRRWARTRQHSLLVNVVDIVFAQFRGMPSNCAEVRIIVQNRKSVVGSGRGDDEIDR
jgi:hypothetical protein